MMMVRHPAAGLAIAGLLALGTSPAEAQVGSDDTAYAAPAHVAVVDGVAVLERQGIAEPAAANVPLVAGDRLRTDRGRLEVLFADGSALDLDQFTTVAVPSDTLLTVLTGRVRLTVDGSDPNEAVSYRIDTPGGTVDIRTVGEYRVSISEGAGTPQVELAVVRGWADLATDRGSVSVRAGERAVARIDAPPSMPYLYNAAAWDAFDQWSDDRRSARLGATSTAYLPSDLVQYGGAFDRYGTWEQNPAYGYVWYPAVSLGWRPYYDGRWSYVASFGWTWIGHDAWSWPTHHYGRWGISAGRWYWIPGHRWGPAWVSWASAPSYVAWCPLGFDGYPVVSFSAFGRGGSYPGYRHHPWTVLPARHFGRPDRAVSTYAVAVTSLDRSARARFAERRPAGLAVPQARAIVSAGVRGSRAVPRASAPGRAVPRAGPGDRSAAPPGLVTGTRPSPAPVRQRAAVPRSGSEEPASLGAMASRAARTRMSPDVSRRTIRIVGQPRASTPANADPGATAGPARQRPAAAPSIAGATDAAPRAIGSAPGSVRRRSPMPGGPALPDRRIVAGPARSAPTRGSDVSGAPLGTARAPSAMPNLRSGASPGPSRAQTRGVRPPSPSPPGGRIQAPAAPSRAPGGVRAPAAPSRPVGGAQGSAASRGSSGGRTAPRATAPKGRPGGGGRPRGGGA